MPAQHRKVMHNIIACRTEELGGEVYFCDPCLEYRYSYHSCMDRHCPKCGNKKADEWLAKQQAVLLPVPYFFVTFTLPHTLGSLARSNQKYFYSAFFHAAAEAMQKLARDPKYIGGQIGFFGVLQTWKRDQGYHPHLHFIVPGGGLAEDGTVWRPSHKKFFLPIFALSKIFRAKLRDALKKMPALYAQVPSETWKKRFGIDCKPVGTGENALKYLTPYIFRVAISNKRLVKMENGNVTFQYRDRETNQPRMRTLPAEEFIRLFLHHVLPHGFVKVRYYGFLAARNRTQLEKIKELLGAAPFENQSCAKTITDSSDDEQNVHVMHCPKCRALMRWLGTIPPKRTRAP